VLILKSAEQRIAYLTRNDLPGLSPGLSFSIFNAKGFREEGIDFELILRRASAGNSDEIVRHLFDVDIKSQLRALRTPRIGKSNLFFYLRAYLYLKKSDRNIVISRNVNFLPWLLALKKKKGIRAYFESHDFWSDPSVRMEPVKKSRRRYIRLERKYIPLMDGVICQSEPQAELYRKCYPDLLVITAMTGCKPARRNTREAFTFTLGYIGSFTTGKYPLEIVMRGLAMSETKPRLLCIGAKNEAEEMAMRERAQQCGVADRVEVHPWTTGAQLNDFKAKMDVGVAILSNTFWNGIASPLKVLEYLSVSLPFIATRLDGVSALVEDGTHGLIVRNDPAEWAAAVDRMYSDFEQYHTMAENCFMLAEKVSWQTRARKIVRELAADGRMDFSEA
jgi:glycosyltransferase involved in cell wall biosynthesis